MAIAPAGAPDETTVDGAMEVVSPGFFHAIGMTVLDGRTFEWHDDERSRGVAIVNDTLARRLAGGGRALGMRIRLGAESHRQDLEIVGVVGDARFGDYRGAPVPMAFRPRLQEPRLLRQPIVLVRSSPGADAAAATLVQAVESMGREYVSRPGSLADQIDRSMIEDRLMAGLARWFAGLAYLLTLTGVYAVLAHGFTRRTREIGVRLALGATRARIAAMVIRQGLRATLAGLVLGVPLALVIGRVMASLLFDLSPMDPVTLALVTAACVAAAIGAALIPAARTSRVDPVAALSVE